MPKLHPYEESLVKMNPMVLAGMPLLLVVVGMAALVWHMYARQRAESVYHADLSRSIQVRSDAFEDNGDMPVECSCEGDGISPPLQWTNLPEGTKSVVLLATDEDLPSDRFALFKIVHWVLYDIPNDVTELEAGVASEALQEMGIAVGPNWAREPEFYPPCPVSGRHRYVFRVYALDVDTLQPKNSARGNVLNAMDGHILAYGELSGFYAK
jgi:Raf kinase inhibitor-like YbhB/YbcL family protein